MEGLVVYVIVALFFVFCLGKAAKDTVSDRTDCFNHCFYFRKNECHWFGKGHQAKFPCSEYMENFDVKYLPEDEE